MCVANIAMQYLICIANDKNCIANCNAIQLNLSTDNAHPKVQSYRMWMGEGYTVHVWGTVTSAVHFVHLLCVQVHGAKCSRS